MREQPFTIRVVTTTSKRRRRTRIVRVKACNAEQAFKRVLDRYGNGFLAIDRMDVVTKGRVGA